MKKEFLIAGLMSATLLGANPAIVSAAERDRGNPRWSAQAERPAQRQRSEVRTNISPRPAVQQRQRVERPRNQASNIQPPRASSARPDRNRPAVAATPNRPDRNRVERMQNRRVEAPQNQAQQRRDNRPSANRPAARQNRPDAVQNRERQNRDQARANDRRDWRDDRNRDNRANARPNQNAWNDRDRNWNNRNGNDRNWNDRNRNDRNWNDRNRNDRNWNDRNRNIARHNWDRDWRRDQRYDWQRYRARYGDRYRYAYHAPRGWGYGYSRFAIGISIWSGLYSSQYWINDPYYYRLPPAHGSLRWVRYYDDALLVDIRSGYVVDVIYDFFW